MIFFTHEDNLYWYGLTLFLWCVSWGRWWEVHSQKGEKGVRLRPSWTKSRKECDSEFDLGLSFTFFPFRGSRGIRVIGSRYRKGNGPEGTLWFELNHKNGNDRFKTYRSSSSKEFYQQKSSSKIKGCKPTKWLVVRYLSYERRGKWEKRWRGKINSEIEKKTSNDIKADGCREQEQLMQWPGRKRATATWMRRNDRRVGGNGNNIEK